MWSRALPALQGTVREPSPIAKWRVPLALLLALMLIVPLGWVLRLALEGPKPLSAQNGDGKLVPRFSATEHGHLHTLYGHCRGDEDCDPPLVCLTGLLLVKPFCTASECMTSQDCREGFSCRSLAVGQRIVRLCAVDGEVDEGGPCLKIPKRPSQGCKRELICAGDICGRPCAPEEPQSCPPGFFCGSEDVEGAACLPTCEGRPCTQGEQCVRITQGASVCARVHGRECQLEPCPAEQKCEVVTSATRPGHAWMKCLPPCGEQQCPEGWLCVGGACRRMCETGTASTCGPEETCQMLAPGLPSLCAFDI